MLGPWGQVLNKRRGRLIEKIQYFDQNYGNLFGTAFPIPVISPKVVRKKQQFTV